MEEDNTPRYVHVMGVRSWTDGRRKLIHSHGGFELVVDRLVSCYRLLLVCSVISLIIVPLDVGYCSLHSIICL